MAGDSEVRPHRMWIEWDGDGSTFVSRIECPHEHRGAERPCATWADESMTKRNDECVYQQYAEALNLDEWIHGSIILGPIPLVEGDGYGEDWHAVILKEQG